MQTVTTDSTANKPPVNLHWCDGLESNLETIRSLGKVPKFVLEFRYCPWCGESLLLNAGKGLLTPPIIHDDHR